METQSAQRPSHHSRRIVSVFVTVIVMIGLVTVLLRHKPALPSLGQGNVPVPFAFDNSLTGSISEIGIKDRAVVRVIDFSDGVDVETLQGTNQVDRIDFVLTPDDQGISHGATLLDAITPGKKIFGYKYTTQDAALEKQRRSELAAGTHQHSFAELFPGEFFVSDEQRSFDTYIQAFERDRSVTFKPMSQVILSRNARYIIVANDPGTSIAVRNLQYCGDSRLRSQSSEQCDDGNTNDADGCTQQCVLSPNPLSVSNANPDVNATAIPTGSALAVGQFRFSMAALANASLSSHRASLEKILFSVRSVNVDIGNDFAFYNKEDATTSQSCTPVNQNGDALMEMTITGNFFVLCTLSQSLLDTTVVQDSDKTFVLALTVHQPRIDVAAPSFLQVSLENLTNASFQASATVSPVQSHIQWRNTNLTQNAFSTFYFTGGGTARIDSTLYGDIVTQCGNQNTDVAFGEQCDDGNTTSGDGCSPRCKNEVCGNGIPDPNEQCDDGNQNDNDTCSNACQLISAPF